MTSSFYSRFGRRFLFAAVTVLLSVAIFYLPRTRSEAAKEVATRTLSQVETYPNYDIRMEKDADEQIAQFRSEAGRNAFQIADARDAMVRGENELKLRVPTLKVEYNLDLKIPELIASDVQQGRAFLTTASNQKRSDILKNFLVQNNELVGARSAQVSELKVFSDYTNPDGKLSFVELNQEINGIPVFRGEVKAAFTKSGEMIRVINNLAPGLERASVSTDFGDPAEAVRRAATKINNSLANAALTKNEKASTDLRVVFGDGDFVPIAEKIYFPTEPGVAVPAWRVLIWQRVNSYYVIVDAKSGTMLWRKNITEDQTQAATYNVYANPTAMANIADSPFPMSPGTNGPTGFQGTSIPRMSITRIGNEAPYNFNNLGWITDGGNTTDGNNVQAGLDREDPNLGDLDANAIDPNGMATGSPNRVFNFPFSPGIPTNPVQNTGDSPLPPGQSAQTCLEEGTNALPTDFQKAAVTQLFYITNVFHDEVYRLGFTEAARNFQNDNFGRGGLGGDRISAQAQDCSGVNNANFASTADGTRPQMQMYLWSAPDPDFDGSLDAEVVIHELTHGLSNRLHGNSSSLTLDIARGMGEGWSDFYAHCLLSEPTDPIDGIYPLGGYDTYNFSSVGLNNYYYGIRRFPKAIMSAVGGVGNRPFNPLTFADIDSTQANISDGAYPPRFNPTADQVHAIGEVWSSALWEVRAKMVQRLGWEVGNRRVLQIVTDGMKMAPLGPTPISERDAMIAGVFGSGDEADLADIWAGFAIRGLGANAVVQNVGGISTSGLGSVRVSQSFELPNLSQAPEIGVDDSTGDNDGYPEPGETVRLTIPLTNSTGTAATNVTLQVVGGGSASYGTLSGISTASQTVTYEVPAVTCGSTANVTLNIMSSLGPISMTRSFFVGRPDLTTNSENFDGVSAPMIPTGWSVESEAGGSKFVTSATESDTAPNTMFALDPTTVGGGTTLTAPYVSVTSPTSTVTFRNSYNTEFSSTNPALGWDGGVLEISIGGGAFQDILEAGGSFSQNGYNRILGGGRNNPLANRAAWSGNSNGYLTTVAQLPSSANGKIVQLRWRFGADDNTAGSGPNPGWRVDSINLSGAGFVSTFACSLAANSVEVSGRVLTPSGQALRNATVSIIDSLGVSRRTATSSFGVYRFDAVQTRQTYTVTVGSKRYRFAAQILNPLIGTLTNFDLVGLE